MIGRIEIKTGNCANIRKQAVPQTKEAYLIVIPWRTKISRRRAKVAIPRGQLDYLKPIIKQLGENYASLACDDPDFLAKLNAWANTGLLERAIDDPAHQHKEKIAIL